nr:trypsin-like serine protease [Roseococcus sp. MDT2-1-1]
MLLAAPAAAQYPPPRGELPGVRVDDPRRPVDVRHAPWSAIGRVQTELGGRCTGTLVEPRLVLTAAHCLVSPRSRQLVQPSSVHFLQAYNRGHYSAHGRVVGFRTGDGYRPDASGPPDSDWALLLLAEPLPGPVLPAWARGLPPRLELALGGYQQDRPEQLLADTSCQLLAVAAGMVVHDCAGTRGASGAPLLAVIGNAWHVVGIANRVRRDVAIGEAVGLHGVRRFVEGQ